MVVPKSGGKAAVEGALKICIDTTIAERLSSLKNLFSKET
jgi:hypothetical protein